MDGKSIRQETDFQRLVRSLKTIGDFMKFEMMLVPNQATLRRLLITATGTKRLL